MFCMITSHWNPSMWLVGFRCTMMDIVWSRTKHLRLRWDRIRWSSQIFSYPAMWMTGSFIFRTQGKHYLTMSVVARFGNQFALNLEKPGKVPGSEDEVHEEFELHMLQTLQYCVPVHSVEICHYAPTAFPFPTLAPTPKPPRTKHKLVAEGRKLTFRCGKKIAAKQGKVEWVLRKFQIMVHQESTAFHRRLPLGSLIIH